MILQGLQIVWINVLLSGDNAVVIALACRGLDPRRRRWAIGCGSGVAVALRIVLTFFVVALLALPFVKIVGGLLLFFIAYRLLAGEGTDKDVDASSSIWGAVRTIAVADAVMSLDNVVAVAAAARNSTPLIVFGIAVSVPLIVFGSTLMLRLLNRFPLLVAAGAALLGWVAGEMVASDRAFEDWFGIGLKPFALWAGGVGAALVLVAAIALRGFPASAGSPPLDAPAR